MSVIVKHPYFWVGVIAGWILFNILSLRTAEKEKYKPYPKASVIPAAEKMLQSFLSGRLLPLEEVFPDCTSAAERGRKAWESCAYWLVDIYASYRYLSTPMEAFFDMVDSYWGKDSGPAGKMLAFNEILNRSTNYYTISGMPYSEHQKLDRTPLYQMTLLIVDSYEDSVYKVK